MTATVSPPSHIAPHGNSLVNRMVSEADRPA